MEVTTFTQEYTVSFPPAKMFQTMILEFHTLLQKTLSQEIKSVDLEHGQWDSPGCISKTTFTGGREKGGTGGGRNNPSRAYVPDAKAMVAAPADVIEYPNAYLFIVDMPGISVTEIQVQLENDNVLVVSRELKHKEEKDEKEGVKYLRKERVGKFMRKFQLPENSNTEAISAVTQDGVLMVTVKKLRPPKGKTIQVNGVLTLTVKKLPPPEPKKGVTVKKLPPLEPKKVKTIQVKVA